MTNSDVQILDEKKAKIKAFMAALTPVAFAVIDSGSENDKKDLEQTLKRIEKSLVEAITVNPYSDFQLIAKKKEAIKSCIDSLAPVNTIDCANENAKTTLDKALNEIVKILVEASNDQSDYQLLKQKEAALISCIDALAPINMMDCTNAEAKTALDEALRSIATYPNIDSFKRRVLKDSTPDHYAFIARTHLLGIDLTGEYSPVSIILINEALGNALELLQSH